MLGGDDARCLEVPHHQRPQGFPGERHQHGVCQIDIPQVRIVFQGQRQHFRLDILKQISQRFTVINYLLKKSFQKQYIFKQKHLLR